MRNYLFIIQTKPPARLLPPVVPAKDTGWDENWFAELFYKDGGLLPKISISPDGMDRDTGRWTRTGQLSKYFTTEVDHRSSKQETGHYLFLPSSTYQYIYNGPLSHSASSRKIKWPKIFLFLVAFAVFFTPKLLLLVGFFINFENCCTIIIIQHWTL